MIKITDGNKASIIYNNGRNTGYSEGYIDGLKSKIERLDPNPAEIMTFFFNKDKMTLDQVKIIFDSIKGEFPDNCVIALPDTTSLKCCSKDFLNDMKNIISKIIEDL